MKFLKKTLIKKVVWVIVFFCFYNSDFICMDYKDQLIKIFQVKVAKLIQNKECLDNPIILNKKEPSWLIAFFIASHDLGQDFLDLIMKEKISLNILDKVLESQINTPLITAVYFGNLKVVKTFLEYKVNPNFKSSLKMTPLCMAIDSFAENNYEIARLLLKFKADPNDISRDSEIPIIKSVIACRNHGKKFRKNDDYWKKQHEKSLNIVKILLYYGADPYKKNLAGINAIDIAKSNGLKDLASLMENSKEILIKKLTILLSRGQTPFCRDIAGVVARFVYEH